MEYMAKFDFPLCRDVIEYEKLIKIGQGTFGEVFKARGKGGKFVALKKILPIGHKESASCSTVFGFPITALREIRILQLLKHENVINLIEICCSKPNATNKSMTFFLVFDFCEYDLAGLLLNNNVKFSLGDIKSVMKQLMNALFYIHFKKILHRDVKSANVLITKNGILKLADFGLARDFSIQKDGVPNSFTNEVVTLWYRAPELLLGDKNYGPSVDMWSAGCVMAEMWTRKPIMQGNTEQQQLKIISHLCGSICVESWPSVEHLDLYKKLDLPKGQKPKVKDRLKRYIEDTHAGDLLDKLLLLDPSKRIDANTALDHDFFWVDPLPADLSKMLAPHRRSMFQYVAAQQKKRAHAVDNEISSKKILISDYQGYQDHVY